jgi:hypothetical protein
MPFIPSLRFSGKKYARTLGYLKSVFEAAGVSGCFLLSAKTAIPSRIAAPYYFL